MSDISPAFAPVETKTTPFGAPVVRKSALQNPSRPQSGATAVRAIGGRLLTVREVAELLRLSTATVYALVERGDLPHVRVSNAIRIAESHLAAFVASGANAKVLHT